MPAVGEIKTGFYLMIGFLLAAIVIGFVVHLAVGS
jgi:hypothetical protein